MFEQLIDRDDWKFRPFEYFQLCESHSQLLSDPDITYRRAFIASTESVGSWLKDRANKHAATELLKLVDATTEHLSSIAHHFSTKVVDHFVKEADDIKNKIHNKTLNESKFERMMPKGYAYEMATTKEGIAEEERLITSMQNLLKGDICQTFEEFRFFNRTINKEFESFETFKLYNDDGLPKLSQDQNLSLHGDKTYKDLGYDATWCQFIIDEVEKTTKKINMVSEIMTDWKQYAKRVEDIVSKFENVKQDSEKFKCISWQNHILYSLYADIFYHAWGVFFSHGEYVAVRIADLFE